MGTFWIDHEGRAKEVFQRTGCGVQVNEGTQDDYFEHSGLHMLKARAATPGKPSLTAQPTQCP